jgi:hypothetical protein
METTESTPERPTLLTVLCILTFVWCGFSIISGLLGMITNSPEKQMERIEQLRETMPEMAESMEALVLESQSSFWLRYQNLFSLILNIGSLIGALMMWNLKKTGFHIYTLCELIPYVFLFGAGKATMNAMAGMFGGLAQGGMAVVMAILIIFDALFIGLYAMNLKHMK